MTLDDLATIQNDARSNLGPLVVPRIVEAIGRAEAERQTPGTHADLSAIVKDPRAWKVSKRGGLRHDEATLKRPPRGFDPDHPLIDDLKRLSFTSGARFSEHQACAPDFSARFVAACRRAVPLMRFLARAMGLAF